MNKPLFFGLSLILSFFLAPAKAEEIYFFRGGFDIFSTGMNQMAAQLREQKLQASSHSFMAWKSIANDIVNRAAEKKVSYPIIVLGHSFGADVVVDFANYLGQHGIPTELVIGFDPNGSRVFRLGAKNAINYRSARVDRYVKGEGFRGTIRNVDVSHYGANHFNIEQVKAVQELALKEVLAKAKVKSTRRRR